VTFKKVVAGDYFSMALTTDGKLYSWGSNVCFVFITCARCIVLLVLVLRNNCCLLFEKDVGQLGLGEGSSRTVTQPTLVTGNSSGGGHGELTDKTIIDIAAGTKHSLAIISTGQIYSWGSNLGYVKTKKATAFISQISNTIVVI